MNLSLGLLNIPKNKNVRTVGTSQKVMCPPAGVSYFNLINRTHKGFNHDQ